MKRGNDKGLRAATPAARGSSGSRVTVPGIGGGRMSDMKRAYFAQAGVSEFLCFARSYRLSALLSGRMQTRIGQDPARHPLDAIFTARPLGSMHY